MSGGGHSLGALDACGPFPSQLPTTTPLPQDTTERFITLVIAKKGPHEHWPRLLKAAGKPAPNVKARP